MSIGSNTVMRGAWQDRLAGGLIWALLGVTLVFLLLPLVVAVVMSLDSRPFLGQLPPPSLSLQWYAKVFTSDYIGPSFATSLVVALVAVALNATAGTAAAVAITSGRLPGSRLLAQLFLSPLVVPAVVIGFGLLLVLARLGITSGIGRLMLGHIVITLPYAIRACMASLVGQDRRLTEAAAILGANEWQAFRSVTLPLIRTGIITGAIFTLAISLDDVAVSMFLVDRQNITLPVALVTHMRAAFDLTIAAIAVMAMVFTAFVVLILDVTLGIDRVIGQGLYRSEKENS